LTTICAIAHPILHPTSHAINIAIYTRKASTRFSRFDEAGAAEKVVSLLVVNQLFLMRRSRLGPARRLANMFSHVPLEALIIFNSTKLIKSNIDIAESARFVSRATAKSKPARRVFVSLSTVLLMFTRQASPKNIVPGFVRRMQTKSFVSKHLF
jgi:hypothetical protein